MNEKQSKQDNEKPNTTANADEAQPAQNGLKIKIKSKVKAGWSKKR